MTEVVSAAVSEFGSLDIMANVAGIMVEQLMLDVTPDDFNRVLAVNLHGVLYGCQAAARLMNDGGSIVNVASSIIDYASAGRGSYAASKGGVVHITRTLALELGARDIRVNGVAPGWTVSGLTRRHFLNAAGEFDYERQKEVVDQKSAGSPLGRVCTPRDTALAVLYLASDAGSYYTGQILRSNGGVPMV